MAEINWDEVKKSTEKLGVFIYFIVGLIVAGTISYVLYTRFNKQIAAVLVFMATVMALYYYYVKWFVIGDDFEIPKSFCPDLMSSIGAKGNQIVCVDSMGVYGGSPNVSLDTIKNEGQYGNAEHQKTGFVGSIGGGGVVMPPDADNKDAYYATFCGNLKTAGISWISLCQNIVSA